MALNATVYSFEVELSDVDRGVYATVALRAARHPSETPEYLLTRVLAYCLEYTEGLEMSRGLAEPDEPALMVRDLTGALQAWIEVGSPDAARLHKAANTSIGMEVDRKRTLPSAKRPFTPPGCELVAVVEATTSREESVLSQVG